jgi:hypothetical protein
MYIRTAQEVHALGCKFLIVDILETGMDRIIKTSRAFSLCMNNLVIVTRKPSYLVQTEQFEKITFNIGPALFILWAWDHLLWGKRTFGFGRRENLLLYYPKVKATGKKKTLLFQGSLFVAFAIVWAIQTKQKCH